MNMALSILFLWIGCALMFVAFHPLAVEGGKGAPHQVMHSLQATVAAQDSAYNHTNAGNLGAS